MPVVLVLTKFDLLVSHVLLDIAGGDFQQHERANVEAQAMYEESCRHLLGKHPRDMPAEIVSSTSSLYLHSVEGRFDTSVCFQRNQDLVT